MSILINRLKKRESELAYYISSRSTLYSLEPIGVGTPYVESLSSYISRLAYNHNVKVSSLLKGVVSPLLKYTPQNSLAITNQLRRYINENSIISIDYINALEMLTCKKDIQYLTMINWKGIFPNNLTDHYRKWCPICLHQMKFESKEIYEPLIWYLFDIKKCDIHEICLQEECPGCNRKLPHLSSRLVVGYCQYCNIWLGKQSEPKGQPLEEDEKFLMKNYKQLIEVAPNLNMFPHKNYIISSLNKLINELDFKSIHNVADFFGINRSDVSGWIRGKSRPSRTSLFKIAKKTNSTIYNLISSETLNLNINAIMKKQESTSNFEIERYLKNAISSDIPKSLNKIVEEAGFSRTTAKRNFPTLCQEVINNYNLYEKQLLSQKQNEVRRLLINCLSNEKPISLSQFSKEYGISISTARRYAPKLCKELAYKYKEYISKISKEKFDSISSEMEKIVSELQIKGVYPSQGRVQRKMTNPLIFKNKRVRDIYKEIVQSFGYNKNLY